VCGRAPLKPTPPGSSRAADSAVAGIPSRAAAFLTLQRAHWSFTPGTRAPVWGINGRYLGPTIRVWNGDDVKLIYSNRLTENVAMTIRGLQVPGPLIGGAAHDVANADWAPVLPIRQSAATLWYQANTPNRMAQQVYNGLAGMWLVEDEVSKSCRSRTTTAWMISR
jgi:suppressor of ftsI